VHPAAARLGNGHIPGSGQEVNCSWIEVRRDQPFSPAQLGLIQ
jgi:hypothetical protein